MITSRSNSKIKAFRKLKNRKERQEQERFIVEGLRAVGDALDSDYQIESLIYAPDILTSEYGQSLVKTAEERAIPMIAVSRDVFLSLSERKGPKGIALVLKPRWTALGQMKREGMIVGLLRVQDPGNLGTIMRSMDAVGAKSLILLEETADPYDPKAIKASTGGIFGINLVRAALDEIKVWTSGQGLSIIGTSDASSHDYLQHEYGGNTLLLMGSEREGLSQDYQDLCDHVVSIPMVGRCDSLNLAVATSLMLYQISTHQKLRQ